MSTSDIREPWAKMITLKNRRTVWIALAVVAVLLGGWLTASLVFPAKKNADIATAVVGVGDIEKTVLATGALEPSTLVSVGAQVSGQLTSLKVVLGQEVKKGEVIGEIDSQPQENALRTAQAEVANVRAQRSQAAATLAEAKLAFDRQSEMLKADATSQADYDAAQATLKSAQGQLSALDAQISQALVSVENARVDLGYTKIVAPIDGTVVAIVTTEGQTVNANQSAPTIVKIGQLGTMTVKAEISEADVIKVKAGQDVYFTILGDPGKRRYAKLRLIEPAPEAIKTEDSVSTTASTATAIYYNGLFDVPNADGQLRTFMTAQISLVLGQAKNVLTVPSAALGDKSKDGTYQVQVLDERGDPKPRTVKIGLDDGAKAQVISGLKAGEKVVVAAGSAEANAAAGPAGGGRRPNAGGLGF